MTIQINIDNSVEIYFNQTKQEFEFDFRYKGTTERLIRIPYRFISNFEKLAFKHLDELIK